MKNCLKMLIKKIFFVFLLIFGISFACLATKKDNCKPICVYVGCTDYLRDKMGVFVSYGDGTKKMLYKVLGEYSHILDVYPDYSPIADGDEKFDELCKTIDEFLLVKETVEEFDNINIDLSDGEIEIINGLNASQLRDKLNELWGKIDSYLKI